MVDLYQRQINKLESKEKSEDEELRRKRQKLADAQKTIDDLEMFYTKVTADWCDSERRNIGQILYSPPFEFNVGDEGSTGDWGTFELDGVPCQGRLPSGKLHLSFCTLFDAEKFHMFFMFLCSKTCNKKILSYLVLYLQ
jgi:hypothetical protein